VLPMSVGRRTPLGEVSMPARLALMGLLLSADAASAESAIDLFAGANTTCALRASGALSCWGETRFGEPVGPYGMTSVPIPITGLPAGIVEAAVSDASACARTAGGAVWCWGEWTPTYPALAPGLESGGRVR
jgi:hypothetical protein